MVLLTSRLGHFTATLYSLQPQVEYTSKGSPSPEVTGIILPSSLTRDHPITLVFSTRLPVSVCGTVTPSLARGFSRQHGLNSVALPRGENFHSVLSFLTVRADLPTPPTYGLRRCICISEPSLLRPPIARSERM